MFYRLIFERSLHDLASTLAFQAHCGTSISVKLSRRYLMSNSRLQAALAGVAISVGFAFGAGTAQAATITWDMSGGVAPPGMTVGDTQNFTAGGITISAAGFTSSSLTTPTALFLKNNGGDEVGLGVASTGGTNEITGSDVVVVNFSNAIAAGLTASSFDVSMNSSTGGDSWSVMGSNTGTAGSFTPVLSGSDEGVHSGLSLFNFYEVSAPSGDVLLAAVSGVTSPVPLPAALPLFAGGLGFLGWASRRKRRKSAAVAAA
jgi:hypothetical protein